MQNDLSQIKPEVQIKPGDQIEAEVMKEAIRQGELLLAAQLQTRLAFEGKSTASMPWLIALASAAISITVTLRQHSDERWGLSLIMSVFSVGAVIFNIIFSGSVKKWHYVGRNPADFIREIVVKDVILETRKRMKLKFFSKKIGEEDKNNTTSSQIKIDEMLFETAEAYAKAIRYNERTLKSMVSNLYAPTVMLLLGLLAVMAFLIRFPYQPPAAPPPASAPAPTNHP